MAIDTSIMKTHFLTKDIKTIDKIEKFLDMQKILNPHLVDRIMLEIDIIWTDLAYGDGHGCGDTLKELITEYKEAYMSIPKCPLCEGSGLDSPQESTCPMCLGLGHVSEEEDCEFDTHMTPSLD